MRVGPFMCSLLFSWASMAQAQVELGGKASSLAGTPIREGAESSSRMALEPKLKYDLGSSAIRAEGRVRWLDQEGQTREDAEIRELSLAWQGDISAWRVGAQQVNWGRMDILRVIDTLNAVDQHDVFYFEVPETKRSLVMANFEWHRDSDTVQVILAPGVPVDRLPRTISGLPVSVQRPGASVKNSTLAFRYGFERGGWNADLIGIKGWSSTPILTPKLGASGPYLEGTMRRNDRIGFSADKPVGAFVVRLEGVYSLLGSEARSQTPLARKFELGAGVDVRWGEWFLAVQAIGERRLSDEPRDATRRGSTFLSAILQRKWAQDRIDTRAIHIVDKQEHASWSSLQVSCELDARQEIKLQADFFSGGSAASFGSFKARNRVSISHRLEY